VTSRRRIRSSDHQHPTPIIVPDTEKMFNLESKIRKFSLKEIFLVCCILAIVTCYHVFMTKIHSETQTGVSQVTYLNHTNSGTQISSEIIKKKTSLNHSGVQNRTSPNATGKVITLKNEKKSLNHSGVQNRTSPNATGKVITLKNEKKHKYAGKIFAIHSLGCSGSTAMMKTTRSILRAAGIDIVPTEYEILKPQKNPLYEQAEQKLKTERGIKEPTYTEITIESLLMGSKSAKFNNQSIALTVGQIHLEKLLVDNSMKELDISFGHFYRENVLDLLLCRVRDCSRKNIGYPVFAANNSKTELCFQRRKHPEIELKVWLKPETLVDAMNIRIKGNKKTVEEYQQFLSPGTSQVNENMFAYEYTSDEIVFRKSINAWANMLRSMVEIDETIIEEVLLKSRDSRSPVKPHVEEIQNFDEVMIVLEKAGLNSYVRNTT